MYTFRIHEINVTMSTHAMCTRCTEYKRGKRGRYKSTIIQ